MPASAKARRQALTDFRRNEIIGAALKVFGAKGFEAARAEDIAAQAGIAKGTIYLYFESKEDIYEAAVQHAIGRLDERVQARLQEARGIRARLGALISTRLEFWMEQRNLYRLLLTVGREARHRKQTNAALRAATLSILGLFEEGVVSGELKAQPFEPIAWVVLDMLRGANERRLDGIAVHPVGEDAAFILDLTLRLAGFEG